MRDSQIFDIQIIFCQKGGDPGKGTGSVGDVHIDAMGVFDGTAGCVDKGIPIDPCGFKLFIKRIPIPMLQIGLKSFQCVDIMGKENGYIFPVGKADLLPHWGGGGSDSGDVLKASCCDHFHDALPGIAVVYQVYQRSGNDMRQVADGCSDIVVFLVVHDKRNGTHAGYQAAVCFQYPGGYGVRGRQDVIGILQQGGLGIGVARPFAACHGVSADKAMIQSGIVDGIVDGGFDAAHIGEQTVRILNDCFDLRQIAVVFLYRGA